MIAIKIAAIASPSQQKPLEKSQPMRRMTEEQTQRL
jgi:hypothetical protein